MSNSPRRKKIKCIGCGAIFGDSPKPKICPCDKPMLVEYKDLGQLTLEEAQKVYDEATPIPITDKEIDNIINYVMKRIKPKLIND